MMTSQRMTWASEQLLERFVVMPVSSGAPLRSQSEVAVRVRLAGSLWRKNVVANLKTPNVKLESVEFTFGGLFTFDCFKNDRELAPVAMRAYFYVTPSGCVSIASLWVKDHPKALEGLAQWTDVRLPRFQTVLIEAQIEDGLRKERSEDARNVREVAEGYA